MQTATYARIHAVLTLTRKTEPLDLDGAFALTTGKLVSNYSSRKEDLKSVQALVGAGVYSGDYKNTDFIGLQSSAGIIVILGIGSLNGQEERYNHLFAYKRGAELKKLKAQYAKHQCLKRRKRLDRCNPIIHRCAGGFSRGVLRRNSIKTVINMEARTGIEPMSTDLKSLHVT